jgi:hypothetical protein
MNDLSWFLYFADVVYTQNTLEAKEVMNDIHQVIKQQLNNLKK